MALKINPRPELTEEEIKRILVLAEKKGGAFYKVISWMVITGNSLFDSIDAVSGQEKIGSTEARKIQRTFGDISELATGKKWCTHDLRRATLLRLRRLGVEPTLLERFQTHVTELKPRKMCRE